LIWGGSMAAAALAVALSVQQSEGLARILVVVAGLTYFVGVQLPTFIVNVPLNNELQALDPQAMTSAEWGVAREKFEGRWNRSNRFRTCAAIFVSVVLAAVPWVR
jgi:uncharacterized membrane protein